MHYDDSVSAHVLRVKLLVVEAVPVEALHVEEQLKQVGELDELESSLDKSLPEI